MSFPRINHVSHIIIMALSAFYCHFLCGQNVNFTQIDHFGGTSIQYINELYNENGASYISLTYKEELISSLATYENENRTSFFKLDNDFGLEYAVHMMSDDYTVEIYDFIAISDQSYLLLASAGPELIINDSITLTTQFTRQNVLLLMNEYGDILDYLTIETENFAYYADKLLTRNDTLYLPMSTIGKVKIGQDTLVFGKYREKLGLLNIPISDSLIKSEELSYRIYGINEDGSTTISDQCFLNGKHYITGTFTQEMNFGDTTYFNNSNRDDVYLAEVSGNNIVKGFGLVSSSADQAHYLNNINGSLVLTAGMYRSIIPAPDEEPVLISDYGILLASYKEDLSLEWAETFIGQELGSGVPVSDGKGAFLLPIRITEDVKYQNYNYEITTGTLYESQIFKISEGGEFQEFYHLDIDGYFLIEEIIFNNDDLLIGVNFIGTYENTTSDRFDGLLLRMNLISKIPDINDTYLKIYPNPTVDFISIETRDKVESVSVYDQLGRLLIFEENTNTISTSSLVPGLYHVLVLVDGKRYTAKVVKE